MASVGLLLYILHPSSNSVSTSSDTSADAVLNMNVTYVCIKGALPEKEYLVL